jgi:hypothetical protein
MSDWRDSFEEHEGIIRRIAETDLPLSKDMQRLIEEYEHE